MMPSDSLVRRILKLSGVNGPRERDEGFKMTKWCRLTVCVAFCHIKNNEYK